ncbi:MAG TPA: MarR family transcriptional regulator [Rhizobiales bacterium]|nr:transcriptional regulator SlyA [bacterium BMS3Bbin10]HDO52736.1 MarR family transcriptional regulator [Hyphomicrobiales bacterium]
MSTDPYLTRSLGFLLGDVSRLVRKRFDGRVRALGLTRAQWRVLARLRRREGINQTELAEILEIETVTLGRHIDRLEAKGWVERRRDPGDRRAWNLFLKAKVQPVMDKLRVFSEMTRAEALTGIPEAESEHLIDLLLQIKANLLELECPGANRRKAKEAGDGG